MPRQFVACRFHEFDRRSYTYHNDGEPLAIGDRVRVDTNKGVAIVTVTSLPEPPSFATKPVLGREEPAPGKLL